MAITIVDVYIARAAIDDSITRDGEIITVKVDTKPHYLTACF